MARQPSVIYDHNPNNLPDDVLRAIGLMVASSAHTEYCVQQLIGALLGIDDVEVLALTTHMTGPLKDQVARALVELNATTAEVVDTVDELLDAIEQATAHRNLIVHNAFARNPDTGEVFRVRERARGSLEVTLTPVTAEDIRRDADALYKAGLDLIQFMIVWKLRPEPRTRPLRTPLDRTAKARKKRRGLGAGDQQ